MKRLLMRKWRNMYREQNRGLKFYDKKSDKYRAKSYLVEIIVSNPIVLLLPLQLQIFQREKK